MLQYSSPMWWTTKLTTTYLAEWRVDNNVEPSRRVLNYLDIA